MSRFRMGLAVVGKDMREHVIVALGLILAWSMADRWPFWMYLGVLGVAYQVMGRDLREGFLPYLFTKPVARPTVIGLKLGAGVLLLVLSLGVNAAVRDGVYRLAYTFSGLRWLHYIVGPRVDWAEAGFLLSRAAYWLAAGAFVFSWRPSRWTWMWAAPYIYGVWLMAVWPFGLSGAGESWVLAGLTAACAVGAVAEGTIREP